MTENSALSALNEVERQLRTDTHPEDARRAALLHINAHHAGLTRRETAAPTPGQSDKEDHNGARSLCSLSWKGTTVTQVSRADLALTISSGLRKAGDSWILSKFRKAIAEVRSEHAIAEVVADTVIASSWLAERDAASEAGNSQALIDLVDEYERSANPAPYTSERALYERLCFALGREPITAIEDDK